MQCFAYVGPITDLNVLVTDSGTDPSYIRALRDSGLQVIIAEPGPASAPLTNQKHSNKKH
jgi:hypothetical protein